MSGRLRPRRRGRGLLLLEMAVALALLAVVLVVVGELLNISFRLYREVPRRDTMIGRVDTALDRLRRDVWSAHAIKAEGGRLELQEENGTVVWLYETGGVLTRTAAEGSDRKWGELPAMTFAAKGGLVALAVTSGPGGAATVEQVTLVSAWMQANARKGL